MPTPPRHRINEGKYFFGALLHLSRLPLITASLVLLTISVLEKSVFFLSLAGLLCLLSLLVVLMFFVTSRQVLCRLCRVMFLRRLKCSTKKHVPRLLGSHTLPVALSILTLRKRICCPYCGEKHAYFYKKGE